MDDKKKIELTMKAFALVNDYRAGKITYEEMISSLNDFDLDDEEKVELLNHFNWIKERNVESVQKAYI